MARFTIYGGLTLVGLLVAGCQPGFLPKASLSAQHSPVLNESIDYSAASTTTWAFNPPKDTYDRRSLLDLRRLNEAIAGETGFVKLSADRESFLRGDGQPLRFWGVNIGGQKMTREQRQDQARFLAKRGVNLARIHETLTPKTPTGKLTDIDVKTRERIWQQVAAMKQAGIYLSISPYSALHVKPQPHWPVPNGSKGLFGLLFFEPELQNAYKAWWRALLEPVNPYTGIALKDDPAIAYWHLQNEDSLLFWTLQQVQGEDLGQLQKKYGQWLTQKYGAIAQAQAHWGKNTVLPGDNAAAGQMGLYPLYELTQPVKPDTPQGKRLADQTQFLTEAMANFNRQMVQFLRQELGVKQLINANNWRTASTPLLNDAERYSYTPAEVMAVNRYYSGKHQGKKSGWAILNGDRFTDQSVLFNPLAFPLALKQPTGYPFLVTESSWVLPLSYQSEGPLLVSAYQSLLGIDDFNWFVVKGSQWRQPASANGYLPSLGKWNANIPELLGNFPAAALIYRQGYVQAGQTMVEERRSPSDLWQRQPPLITEESGFDPNRDDQPEIRLPSGKRQLNPLAFLVGPVKVQYGSKDTAHRVENLTPYLQRSQKIVRSVTGELTWDYGRGLFTLNAPQAQGVTGFLRSAGTIQLNDVTITAQNTYATAIIVSLDGQALKHSQKILVQVGTQARPTDWQQRAIAWQDQKNSQQSHRGFEVLNYGRAPWRIVHNALTLTIRNPSLTTATVLDMNGMAQQTIPLKRDPQAVQLVFPKDAKYVLLSAAAP